ncbi:hypothetical protein [Actinopolyspora xinjiangensis]|nr:hypothetical protein [Actinopolyspora xinjiangensis]
MIAAPLARRAFEEFLPERQHGFLVESGFLVAAPLRDREKVSGLARS